VKTRDQLPKKNVGLTAEPLIINEPGDRFEREADSVADQVMRAPETPVRLGVFHRHGLLRNIARSGTRHALQIPRSGADEERPGTLVREELLQVLTAASLLAAPGRARTIVREGLTTPLVRMLKGLGV
jgi:hypothetical protein